MIEFRVINIFDIVFVIDTLLIKFLNYFVKNQIYYY